MQKKNIGIGEKLRIDIKGILEDFEELLGPSIEWDKRLNLSNWAKYTNKGNLLLKSSSFTNKFRKILSFAGSHLGKKDFYYQAYPTFRIHLPGTKSVSFHTDDLSSGHAKDIYNFWLPLTKLNKHNCLWIVNQKDTQKLLQRFKTEKFSLNTFDNIAKKKAKPMLINTNEMLCFSNKTLHGTHKNKSKKVRASIDFRCLPINKEPGNRVLGVEYKQFLQTVKKPQIKCISVIFQSGDVRHIGHNAQRSVINDFAARNNFSIIRETSEWHQLYFYPIILDILKNNPETSILIFSKTSFDLRSSAWKFLSNKLKRHKGKIYFCLENEKFN